MKKATKKPTKKINKKRKISKKKVLEYTIFGLKLYKTIKRGL
jgi:hypothetical protein